MAKHGAMSLKMPIISQHFSEYELRLLKRERAPQRSQLKHTEGIDLVFCCQLLPRFLMSNTCLRNFKLALTLVCCNIIS